MNNEFKKSKSNNETRYVLENSATVTTGSVATAPSSLGKVQKRGNILAQEAGKDKVPATTPRNFVAKNAKTSGAGAHKDKKKEQKQGAEKHKKPYMESLRTKIDQLKSKLAEQGVAEAPEDRTSYQVAKILSDRGIKYDPAQENELINAIGMVLVKELNMSPKEARYLISYDEDFVSDTLGELRSMEQSVSEVDVYMESLAHSLQQVLSEKAVSKKQQKFMGMVHAAQKGEKPASKEVAKVAKDMGKKDAKDFAATKHKGLPEKKKSKK
jgi:chorismate mutase